MLRYIHPDLGVEFEDGIPYWYVAGKHDILGGTLLIEEIPVYVGIPFGTLLIEEIPVYVGIPFGTLKKVNVPQEVLDRTNTKRLRICVKNLSRIVSISLTNFVNFNLTHCMKTKMKMK
jgi:hypothetical protein